MFLEISENSQENTCVRDSFLIKLKAKACNFIKKESLAHVFSWKFLKFLRTPFFTEHLRWLLLNFKKFTFARLFSINFLSKSLWCSTVLLKFESYYLQHCKKNCCKLVFWVFTEQLNYQIIIGAYIAMELLL